MPSIGQSMTGSNIVPNEGSEGMAAPARTDRRVTMGAAMIYAIGLIVVGLAPLLWGAMAGAGLLSQSGIGLLTSLEIFATAAGSLLAPFLLTRPGAKRLMLIVAFVPPFCLLALATGLSGPALFVDRGLSGLASGAMISRAMSGIAQTSNPDRSIAIASLVLTIFQAALSLVVPALSIPTFGLPGTFLLLAIITLPSVPLAVMLASGPAQVAEENVGTSVLTLPFLAGLLSVALANLVLTGTWTYIEQLAVSIGMSPAQTGALLFASLILQIAASALIAWQGWQVPFGRVLIPAAMIQCIALALIPLSGSAATFSILFILTLNWIIMSPYHLRMLIDLQPDRAALLYQPAAQIAGAGCGPLLSSLAVAIFDVGASFTLMAVIAGATAILYVGIVRSLRRKP